MAIDDCDELGRQIKRGPKRFTFSRGPKAISPLLRAEIEWTPIRPDGWAVGGGAAVRGYYCGSTSIVDYPCIKCGRGRGTQSWGRGTGLVCDACLDRIGDEIRRREQMEGLLPCDG